MDSFCYGADNVPVVGWTNESYNLLPKLTTAGYPRVDQFEPVNIPGVSPSADNVPSEIDLNTHNSNESFVNSDRRLFSNLNDTEYMIVILFAVVVIVMLLSLYRQISRAEKLITFLMCREFSAHNLQKNI
jgi:hypothetical protein